MFTPSVDLRSIRGFAAVASTTSAVAAEGPTCGTFRSLCREIAAQMAESDVLQIEEQGCRVYGVEPWSLVLDAEVVARERL